MYGYFWQDFFCYGSILENYNKSGLSWDEFLGLLVDSYFDYDGNWYEDHEDCF